MHPGDGRLQQALRLARGHVIVAVKEAAPDGTVKKGEVARAVVVRTVEGGPAAGRLATSASTATRWCCSRPTNNPVGTRIFGPVARELRDRQFTEDHLARPRGHLRTLTMAASRTCGRATRWWWSRARSGASAGKVLRVLPDRERVVVERINMIKKHQRPTQKLRQGGIIEREGPLHLSNVMLVLRQVRQADPDRHAVAGRRQEGRACAGAAARSSTRLGRRRWRRQTSPKAPGQGAPKAGEAGRGGKPARPARRQGRPGGGDGRAGGRRRRKPRGTGDGPAAAARALPDRGRARAHEGARLHAIRSRCRGSRRS